MDEESGSRSLVSGVWQKP